MGYPNTFDRTHLTSQLARKYADTPADELARVQPVVNIAGRLMHKDAGGDSGRGVLQDHSGRIDILISVEATGKSGYAAYASWMAGDIVGVSGLVCRLPGGELAVRAHEIERLVNAVRPLPQGPAAIRYLDLMGNPHTQSVFAIRSRLIAGIRAFLGGTSYLEVETPILQAVPELEATQFRTHHNALRRELYLRASGELYLKQLVVGGVEKVYEINRHFVHEQPAADYCPEATTLEIYCAYSSYLYMMALLEPLVLRSVQHATGASTVTWQGHSLDFGKRFGRITASEALGARLVEPTYVVDFPAAAAPHARRKDAASGTAEQFELYIGGQKIAVGRSEINDPDELPSDCHADFLRAVEFGLPPTSGVKLSIDRLVMVLTGSSSLRDVILFPADAHR